MVLSGVDKTIPTIYRSTLYAGKNLPDEERFTSFEWFIEEVKLKFSSSRDLKKIEEYTEIQKKDIKRRER